jgi:hypothetical protein
MVKLLGGREEEASLDPLPFIPKSMLEKEKNL